MAGSIFKFPIDVVNDTKYEARVTFIPRKIKPFDVSVFLKSNTDAIRDAMVSNINEVDENSNAETKKRVEEQIRKLQEKTSSSLDLH